MKTNIKHIIILGSGPLAKDIADLAEDIPSFNVEGFVIDQPPYNRGSSLDGKPIYWIDDLEEIPKSYFAICGLARMQKSSLIDKVMNLGFRFSSLIHPSARV